jgi:hypothetical protein
MVEREAPLAEVITALGTQAQQVKTLEERRALIDVATTLAQTSEGRFLIDQILGSSFVAWLRFDVASILVWIPAMIVYANSDLTPPRAWLGPWNGEYVWPESELLSRQLSQSISAVWQSNYPAFLELFLLDGPDLQGQMARFARISTPV